MARTHIMIDSETLATSPNAAILTIGAVKFDPLGDELYVPEMESFYVKVDLDSCHELGLEVSDSTIEWWSKQDEEAQAEAFGEAGRVHIKEAFNQLYKFCWGAEAVWSHGAAFDIVLCENVFKKLEKAVPWKYWQAKCSRTLFDLGIDPQRPPVLKHHALADAWNQAVGVQNVCRELQSRGINPFKKV